MNLLIIGKNSILSKLFVKHTSIKKIKIISYKEIKKINFENYTHIVNFAFNPKLRSQNYKVKYDIDLKISQSLIKKKIIYVMLSTRYVYNHDQSIPFTEKSNIRGMNNYGKNKIIVENNLKKILKKKLLILRIGTFLYFNTQKKDLFIHILLNNLKKNKEVVFDLDKNILKDFLTDLFFVKCLDKLLKKNVTGIYNLSSGIPIKPTLIAQNIIKGFGKGIIKFTNYKKKDKSFVLSNKKLFKITKMKLLKKNILNLSINIGKKLKNE